MWAVKDALTITFEFILRKFQVALSVLVVGNVGIMMEIRNVEVIDIPYFLVHNANKWGGKKNITLCVKRLGSISWRLWHPFTYIALSQQCEAIYNIKQYNIKAYNIKLYYCLVTTLHCRVYSLCTYIVLWHPFSYIALSQQCNAICNIKQCKGIQYKAILLPCHNITLLYLLCMFLYSIYYITHKNIPIISLVNTTSRDIKYYAYIPNIWREGKKFLYKMDISLVLRDIVDILLISPMPTVIMWLPWRLLVLVFTDCDQNFGYKLYESENFELELVSDGNLEMLLDNADDPNTNKLIKCVVTQF